MNITKQAGDEMIVKDSNYFSFIIGAIFLIAGIYFVFALNSFSGSVKDILPPVIAFAIGLLVFFANSSIKVTINKTQGTILYRKKRLIGGKTEVFKIADVLRVELRKEYRMKSQNVGTGRGITMTRPTLFLQSVIVMKDGQTVPLDSAKSSSIMTIGGGVLASGQGKEMSVASQIAAFLNVPFQETNPGNPSVGTIS